MKGDQLESNVCCGKWRPDYNRISTSDNCGCCNLAAKCVWSFEGCAAHNTGAALRAGLAPAAWAIKHLRTNLPVHTPIAAVDFENFLLQVILG